MKQDMDRELAIRTRQYKPYPAYRDSGVEWLGDIPTHWDTRRLKTLIAAPITDGPHETPEFLPDGVPFLSVDSIQDGKLIFEGCRCISEAAHRTYSSKCAPIRDDILLGKAASTGKIARVKVHFEFSIWSPLALIRPARGQVEPAYLEYALKGQATQAQIDVLCTSNTQKNISMRDIAKLVIPLPPQPEQRAIGAFLERETGKVDSLVMKKERLIALLREKRGALIARAVTKGLDSNLPMKDSRVQWLGEIPAHWEIRPLFTLINEREEKNGDLRVSNVLSLSYGRIIPRDVESNFGLLPESFETYQIVHPRDIVLRLTDLQNDQRSIRVGFVGEMGIITSAYVCLTVRRTLMPEFAHYVLLGLDILKVFYGLGGGVRQTMKFEDLRWLPIVSPPQEEQRAIVAFLDRETGRIDSLMTKVEEGINRLKELRTALISAAVTGKIEVREKAG